MLAWAELGCTMLRLSLLTLACLAGSNRATGSQQRRPVPADGRLNRTVVHSRVSAVARRRPLPPHRELRPLPQPRPQVARGGAAYSGEGQDSRVLPCGQHATPVAWFVCSLSCAWTEAEVPLQSLPSERGSTHVAQRCLPQDTRQVLNHLPVTSNRWRLRRRARTACAPSCWPLRRSTRTCPRRARWVQ